MNNIDSMASSTMYNLPTNDPLAALSTFDVNKFNAISQHTDPETFKNYLVASIMKIFDSNNNDSNKNNSDIFGIFNASAANSTYTNPTFTPSSNTSPIQASSIYEDMILKAKLIGKKVEAKNAEGKLFTGIVEGVAVESGTNNVLMVVSGEKIPPQNLISIKEW